MKSAVPPPSALETQVIASASSELQGVVVALRDLVLTAHSDATILAWPSHKIISFGFGPKKMTQHYVFVAVHPAHVNLGFYQGASLKVAKPTLQGSGKALRHIKVSTPAEAKAPGLAQLVVLAREHQAQLLKNAA
jgi:hypothetical protein